MDLVENGFNKPRGLPVSRLCYQRRRVCGECIEVYFHGPVSFEDDEASDRAECFEEDKSHRVIRTMSY